MTGAEREALPLACPTCALRYPLSERFCSTCKMPLVYVGADSGADPITSTHERARKVDPRYTEGELVRVAGGRNQAEAELIQGLLLEEGVPSILRRAAGFDVPDFLAAGPRDILVPESGASAASEILLDAELVEPAQDEPRTRSATDPGPLRLTAVILGAGTITALVAWALIQLAG